MSKPQIVVWCNNSLPAQQLIKLLERKNWSFEHRFTSDYPCIVVDGVHISGYARIFSLLA